MVFAVHISTSTQQPSPSVTCTAPFNYTDSYDPTPQKGIYDIYLLHMAYNEAFKKQILWSLDCFHRLKLRQ